MSQAGDDEDALAEERRLLYVGITRARRHLALSWARQRPSATGRPQTPHDVPLPASPGWGRTAVERGSLATGSAVDWRTPDRRTDAVGVDAGAARRAQGAGVGQRSSEDGVPAYVVATDATLAAIAERRPRERGGAAGRARHRARQGREVRCRDPRRRPRATRDAAMPRLLTTCAASVCSYVCERLSCWTTPCSGRPGSGPLSAISRVSDVVNEALRQALSRPGGRCPARSPMVTYGGGGSRRPITNPPTSRTCSTKKTGSDRADRC